VLSVRTCSTSTSSGSGGSSSGGTTTTHYTIPWITLQQMGLETVLERNAAAQQLLDPTTGKLLNVFQACVLGSFVWRVCIQLGIKHQSA